MAIPLSDLINAPGFTRNVEQELRSDVSSDLRLTKALALLVYERQAAKLEPWRNCSEGYMRRESYGHKLEFQDLAVRHAADVKTLSDLKLIKAFDFYIKEYSDRTLRLWVNEVMPDHLQRGRPKNK